MHEYWYGEQKVAREMSKEQLEIHFEFGLSYLHLGQSYISNNNFRLKEYLRKKELKMPVLMEMFCKTDLDNINLRSCGIGKNDMELFSASLYNQIEEFAAF
jgi:hypothetical protein